MYGSATNTGQAGWGMHTTIPVSGATQELRGSVVTRQACTPPVTSLSSSTCTERSPGSEPHSFLPPAALSEHIYVRLFATHSIKPLTNKRLIVRINAMLEMVKQNNDLYISSRTTARGNVDNALAQGNSSAYRFAAQQACRELLEVPRVQSPHGC